MSARYRLGYLLVGGLILGVLLLAALVGQRSFASYFSLGGTRSMLPFWLLPPLLWVGIIVLRLVKKRSDRPTATLLRMIRRHRAWIIRGIVLTMLILPLTRAFGAFKASIPNNVTYWADPQLARLDNLLFLGNDPWMATHWLLGPTATIVIDRIYVSWFMVMMVLMGWIIFTRDQRFQLRGLLTYLGIGLVLGMLGATALASVGPCYYEAFYGSDRFSPLMELLRANPDINAPAVMDWLYENRSNERVGGGISAMPSLHVAIATLFYLACRDSGGSKLLEFGAFIFATAIMVGSVHLGWHYALDGLISIIAVVLMWRLSGRFVAWLDQRERSGGKIRPAQASVSTIG